MTASLLITRVTRWPAAGRFGGLQTLQESLFSPVQGDFVALHGRNKEIFGGGKPPPNPHRVSRVNYTTYTVGILMRRTPRSRSAKTNNDSKKSTAYAT